MFISIALYPQSSSNHLFSLFCFTFNGTSLPVRTSAARRDLEWIASRNRPLLVELLISLPFLPQKMLPALKRNNVLQMTRRRFLEGLRRVALRSRHLSLV